MHSFRKYNPRIIVEADGNKIAMFRQRLYPVAVRLRLGFWPIVQTALAASVAWVLAVGRRPLLLAGMALTLGALGGVFLVPSLAGSIGWIAVASLTLYVAFFAVGLGPVFWLLISEIYPLKVRGSAMSVATMANWGSNLLVALTFLTLVGALVFSYFLVPETKERSLEDIQAYWRKKAGEKVK
jgi:MFS family permease